MINVVGMQLTSAMGLAWDQVRAGEFVVEAAETWGAEDPQAGLVELYMWSSGKLAIAFGEAP